MQQTDIDKILSYKDTDLSYSEISLEVFDTVDKRRLVNYYYSKNKIVRDIPKSKRSIYELSKDELNLVLSELDLFSVKALAEKYKLSIASLTKYLVKNKIKKKTIISNPRENSWTMADEEFLIKNSINLSMEELSQKLNRSLSAIKNKCFELKINSFTNKNTKGISTTWSERDLELLKNNSSLDPLILGFLLQRSFRSIDHKMRELDLKTSRNRKTRIEVIVEDILNRNDIEYVYDQILTNSSPYRPDFYLPELNTVIECQGDYWHGNPYIYSDDCLSEMQRIIRMKDSFKQEFYNTTGFISLFYWETNILSEDFERILLNDIRLISQSPS